MIEIGDKINFRPTAFMSEGAMTKSSRAPVSVWGTVTYINEAHGWYRVEASFNGGAVLRECFKIQ